MMVTCLTHGDIVGGRGGREGRMESWMQGWGGGSVKQGILKRLKGLNILYSQGAFDLSLVVVLV